MILFLRYQSNDIDVLHRIAEDARCRLKYIEGYRKVREFSPLFHHEGGDDELIDDELFA